jgi:hypothetical protein
MKKTPLTYPLLRFRNVMHAVLPGPSNTVEILRQSLQFERVIGRRGLEMPLPPFVKRAILKRYLIDHQLRTLVETGTQYGDTPWLFRRELGEIWSIELSPELASLATERFQRYPNIHILQGDSAEILPRVVLQLKTPVLFWLDGHYSSGITLKGSSECPIYAELSAIMRDCKYRCVILIDDARCFGDQPDYPTIAELENFILRSRPDASVTVANDIIAVTFKN